MKGDFHVRFRENLRVKLPWVTQLVARLRDDTTVMIKMGQIIYKTQPRLFILCMTFLAFVFFGLLFLLTFQIAKEKYNLIILSVLVVFAILSLTSLFYFLTVKIIKLTKDKVIISHLLLPINRTLSLADIKNLEQTKKNVKAVYGGSWYRSSIYTEITTSITLANNGSIKLNSIGQSDYDEFYKTFNKLRRGEGQIKEQKRHFFLYLLDNLDGLSWIVFLSILTIGLAYGIFVK